MFLHDIPALARRRAPDAAALVSLEHGQTAGATATPTTFAGLEDRTARLAGALQELAAPGDRVAIVADNCHAWVDCYYGVPRAGLVLTFLNQRLHPDEQAALVEAAGARVVLGQRRYLDPLGGGHLPGVRTVVDLDADYDDLLAAAPPQVRATARSETDPAWLLFTSGTTGRPKGAVLTHRSISAAILTTALARPVAGDDTYLFPFPLCHVAGYNVPLFHLHARPVVLLPKFDAAGFVDTVNRHAVTAASLAPTMISSLLDHLDATGGDVPSLRAIGYGASPIPPAVLRRTLARLPGVGFSQGYGMTELSGNAVFLDAEDHRRAAGDPASEHLLGAAGRPSPLVSVAVVDDNGHELPTGATGEIAVRGDQVLLGYWRDPDATAAAFTADGWFRTGDVGRFDRDGYLYVVDRKKDIIVTGGENVASREVEDVVQAHPAVREAAVVGVPDPHWGEAVCAVVALRDGSHVTADELVAFVRDRLAGFKKPRHVVFVDELPRNAGGKVLKQLLREQVAW